MLPQNAGNFLPLVAGHFWPLYKVIDALFGSWKMQRTGNPLKYFFNTNLLLLKSIHYLMCYMTM